MKKLFIFLMIAIPLAVIIVVNLTVETVSGYVPISVDKVEIVEDSIVTKFNDTYSLAAKIYPESATNQEIVWSSDNEDVAVVDLMGNVTFVGIGKVHITATSVDGKKADSCYFYCSDSKVHGVDLFAPDEQLAVGKRMQLSASVVPMEAVDKNITYSVDDESVATIDSNGLLTALKEGFVSITATSHDGGFFDVARIRVYVPVQSISLSIDSATISESFYTLSHTVFPLNATNKSVTYLSSDTDIATVSAYGIVVFKKAGTVEVRVVTNDGAKEASAYITSTDGYANVLNVEKAMIDAVLGDAPMYINYLVLPNNSYKALVSFSSSNEDVVTVDENGLIAFVGGGNALITVSTNSSATEMLTQMIMVMVEYPAERIIIDPIITTAQKEYTLKPQSYPQESTNHNFFFHSRDEQIAVVNSFGEVSFKKNMEAEVLIDIYANYDLSSVFETVKISYTNGFPTEFSLITNSLEISKGSSAKILSTFAPTNAINKTVSYEIVENHKNGGGDENVVTMLSDGTVIGNFGGTAIVKVSMVLVGGVKQEKYCSVVVNRFASSVEVNLSLEKENDVYLTASNVVYFSANVLPSDVSSKQIVWSVEGKTNVVLSDDSIVFNEKGAIKLVCKTKDGMAKNFVNLRYIGPNPTSAVISEIPRIWQLGDEVDISLVSIFPSNAENYSLTIEVINELTLAENGNVLSVFGNCVKAVAGGTATIVVYVGTVRMAIEIEVNALPTSIETTPKNISTTSNVVELFSLVLPIYATDKTVLYSLEESDFATLDGKVLTFTQNGKVFVTARSLADENVFESFFIEKVDKGTSTAVISENKISLMIGDTALLNLADFGVVFNSYDLEVIEGETSISLDDNKISALQKGEAKIRCSFYDSYDSEIVAYVVDVIVIKKVDSVSFASNIDVLGGEYVTANDIFDLQYNILPIDASNTVVNSSIVASVDSNGNDNSFIASLDENTITFNEKGVVQIKAVSADGNYEFLYRIRYTGGDAISSSLNVEDSFEMEIGDMVEINVSKWFPKDTTNRFIAVSEISHSQGVSQVISIESNVLTAIAGGTSVVFVELSNGLSKTLNIRVLQKAQSIQIESNEILTSLSTYTISASVLPSSTTIKTLSYSMDEVDFAVLSSNVITFSKAGTVSVKIAAMDDSGVETTVFVRSTFGAVSQINLNETSKKLDKGTYFSLFCQNFLPLDILDCVLTYEIISSTANDGSETEVVSISDLGVISALYGGIATIRVRTTNATSQDVYADCVVEVVCKVTSISLSFDKKLVYSHKSVMTSKMELPFSVVVLPADATVKSYRLIRSEIGVVEIEGETIKFLKAGQSYLTVIADDDSNGVKSDKYLLHSTEGEVFKVVFDDSEFLTSEKILTIEAGQEKDLELKEILPADHEGIFFYCSDKQETRNYSALSVVSITSDKIVALNGGEAKINLLCCGVNLGEYKIRVVRRGQEVVTNQSDVYISTPVYNIVCDILPVDTTNKNLVFTASNDIATVDATGLVEFRMFGKTEITIALQENPELFCIISIDYSNTVKRIEFTNSATAVYINDGLNLKVTGSPSNCEPYEIIYSVDNEELASVTPSGRFIAKDKTGTVVVTAVVKNRPSIFTTQIISIIQYISDIELEFDEVDDSRGIGGYRVFGYKWLNKVETGETVFINSYTIKIKSITPAIENPSLIWTTSNPEVATIDGGLMVVNRTGTVTITVKPELQYNQAYPLTDSYTFTFVKGINCYSLQQLEYARKFDAVIMHCDMINGQDVLMPTFMTSFGLYGNGHLLDMSASTNYNKAFIAHNDVIIDNVTIRANSFSSTSELYELEDKSRVVCVGVKSNNTLFRNTILENGHLGVELYSSEVRFEGCIIRNTYSAGIIITNVPNQPVSKVVVKDCAFSRNLFGSILFNLDKEEGWESRTSQLSLEGKIYFYNWIKPDEFCGNLVSENLGNQLETAKQMLLSYDQVLYTYKGEKYFCIGVVHVLIQGGPFALHSNGTTDLSKLDASTPYIQQTFSGIIKVFGVPINVDIKVLTQYANNAHITPEDKLEDNVNLYQSIKQPYTYFKGN